MRHRVAATLAAALLYALALLAPAVGPSVGPLLVPAARAATPDLALVTAARYTADPDHNRVIVSIDITATNNKPDTVIRRYYFEGAYLAVHPEARGLRATSDEGDPSVAVSRRTSTYAMLRIDFGQKLFSGESMELRVSFTLDDRGGPLDRPIRVGASLVAFPVWAYGSESTPGSTVTVVFPAGFTVRVAQGELQGPTTTSDGRVVLRSGPLAHPLAFSAYVVGDRPPEYASVPLNTTIGGQAVALELRPWADDPDWAARVGDVFGGGLPALAEAIALPYPYTEPLVVQEAPSRALGGYAGLFDPAAGRVEVAYDASEYVALHEAAHAWFNASLLADRWANEGFASYYAGSLASELDVEGLPTDTVEDAAAGRVPLNAWGAVGAEGEDVERFGYAASAELARLVGERAGEDGLRATWRAAADDASAYAGDVGLEVAPVDAPVDWRRLLDLLEATTDATYDDLWLDWVVRPGEAPLIEQRAAARADLAEAVEAAGDWTLPAPIVAAMDAWRYEQAVDLLDQAQEVIAERAVLEARAEAAGTSLPDTLEDAFEGASGPAAAVAEAGAIGAALGYIEGAIAVRPPADADVQVQVGLLGEDPEADLEAARRALEVGDLDDAVLRATTASHTWQSAASVGWQRILAAIGLTLAAVTLAVLAVMAIRHRRQGRPRVIATGSGYATLRANPEERAAIPGGDHAHPMTDWQPDADGPEDRP